MNDHLRLKGCEAPGGGPAQGRVGGAKTRFSVGDGSVHLIVSADGGFDGDVMVVGPSTGVGPDPPDRREVGTGIADGEGSFAVGVANDHGTRDGILGEDFPAFVARECGRLGEVEVAEMGKRKMFLDIGTGGIMRLACRPRCGVEFERRFAGEQRVLRPDEMQGKSGRVMKSVMGVKSGTVELKGALEVVGEANAAVEGGDGVRGDGGFGGEGPEFAMVGDGDALIGVVGVWAWGDAGEALVPGGVPPLGIRDAVKRRTLRTGGMRVLKE